MQRLKKILLSGVDHFLTVGDNMNNKGILFIPLMLLIAAVSVIIVSIEGSKQDEDQRSRELICETVYP